MKAFRVAATVLALAFAPTMAGAAVLMNFSGTTGYDCALDGKCYATAQVDFNLPTFGYIQPTLEAGPLTGAPLPSRYTYRVVMTLPGAAWETVSSFHPNSDDWYYRYENGQLIPYSQNADHFVFFSPCYSGGSCELSGYAQGNRATFQFGDGINIYSPFNDAYNEGDLANLLIGYTGGASLAAFLDPSQAGLPFTAQVFQFAAVPEPSTWAMLIVGFGMGGAMLRRRRGTVRKLSVG